MATSTQGDILKRADLMLDGLSRNEIPGIGPLVTQLAGARAGAKDALARRALHDAQSQQASRDLDVEMVSVNVFYSRVRRVLQGYYGVREEKLAEFGLQPLRPVPRAKPTEPPPPEQTPPEQFQSATQAATPGAVGTT